MTDATSGTCSRRLQESGSVLLFPLGVALMLAGTALILDLGGAGSAVIRHVTSRSLGDLAPGYAATPTGFRVYAGLVLVVGVGVVAAGLLPTAPVLAIAAGSVATVAFLAGSAIAVRGEVRTYRAGRLTR